MSLIEEDSRRFGFDSDAWLEQLAKARAAEVLGSLGPYELIAEAGRGGQGVVFRARQPGTGREIALKRLLAGAFASPEASRRFEREVEAATTLSHPGIVTVYGVDVVQGAPLLAMEWIDGVAVTRWVQGRPRAEVLRVFLLVCDAVQHAHQRGVLHRDLKPSNVLVDRSGQPRLLDFGLAKLTSRSEASLTTSGQFLGTPAFAAPEQWRGGELDARADVYSLGAILFQMLTGRAVIEGEGLDAVARASARSEPPRPSSLSRSIPRDLDAIVLQALANEREERYQSVDALSADVRRFLAGEPVLAHPRGALYVLRKLVARYRLASALVAALVLGSLATGVAYAVVSARHARRLTAERDRALAASAAADRARQETEEQRRLAEAARDAAQGEEQRAKAEQENTEAVLSFFLVDILPTGVNPVRLDHQPTLLELLRSAVPKIAERFGDDPFVEARVRGELGIALASLGDNVNAERELRIALATRTRDPSSTPAEIADLEAFLGSTLALLGRHGEAEELLLSAEARTLADDPRSADLWRLYGELSHLYKAANRLEDCDRALTRQLECARDERERVVTLGSRATLKGMRGRPSESIAEIDALLPETEAACGEDSGDVGILLHNRAICREILHDFEGAESDIRRVLSIQTRLYGPEHAIIGEAMRVLASILLESDEFRPEAEELARRSVEIMRATSNDGEQLATSLEWLAEVLYRRRDFAGATSCMLEALALNERIFGRGEQDWVRCAKISVLKLARNGLTDEAEELLEQIATQILQRADLEPFGPSPGLALRFRATIEEQRGNLGEAVALYDEAIALMRTDRRDHDALPAAFTDFAALLRELGDEEGAVEVERQAAELAK